MADINALKKKYSSPDIDIAETKDDERHDGNKYSLPYGLCKGVGIDTTGMSPREAWEAYENKTGISKKEAEEKHWDKTEKKEEPRKNGNTQEQGTIETRKKIDEQIKKAQDNPRFYESKRFSKQRLADNLNAGTEEMNECTARLFNDDNFGYNANEKETAFYPGYNKVCIAEQDDGGDSSPHAKGAVFYHETWHAIDYNYAEMPNDKHPRFSYPTLSNDYVLSNGKTMEEIRKEESRNVDWQAIKDKIEQERQDFFKKEGKDVKEITDRYNAVKAKLYDINTGDINLDNKARNELRNSEEYKKAINDWISIQGYPKSLMRKWGDLSDIYCAYRGGTFSLVDMGHDAKYWKQRPGSKARETFADIASAKATNEESYSTLKTYVPNMVSAFEEIYEKLKKGEIKHNARQEYKY